MIDVTAPTLALYGVPAAKNITLGGTTTYYLRASDGTATSTTSAAVMAAAVATGSVVEEIETS